MAVVTWSPSLCKSLYPRCVSMCLKIVPQHPLVWCGMWARHVPHRDSSVACLYWISETLSPGQQRSLALGCMLWLTLVLSQLVQVQSLGPVYMDCIVLTPSWVKWPAHKPSSDWSNGCCLGSSLDCVWWYWVLYCRISRLEIVFLTLSDFFCGKLLPVCSLSLTMDIYQWDI